MTTLDLHGPGDVLDALAVHGGDVLLGVSVVLLAGCVAVAATRAVAPRRSVGVAAAWGTALYLGLALVPMPRWWQPPPAPDAPAPAGSFAGRLDDVVSRDRNDDVSLAARRLALRVQPERPSSGAAHVPLAAGAAAAIGDDAPPALAVAPAAAPAPARATVTRPADTTAVTARERPMGTWLAATWVLGTTIVLMRLALGHLRLRWLLARCRPWPGALAGIVLPRGAHVLASPRRVRPFCAGVWRPVVVLPAELAAPDRAHEAFAVLQHEAAHLRAGDARVQTLLAWLTAPLWFHPLLWWLCRQVRFCGELLADDAAARTDRNHYARALLDLAERGHPAVATPVAVSACQRPSEFYRRIQMLLQRQGSLSPSPSRGRNAAHSFATLTLVGLAAATFGVPATAQDPMGRTLRKENAELRDTIATLRAELATLRDQIAQLAPPAVAWPVGAGGGIAPDPSVGALVDPVIDALRVLDPFQNDATTGPAPGRPAPGVGAPAECPPPDGAGVATRAEVPLLAGVPVLGNLFRAGSDGLPGELLPVTLPAPSAHDPAAPATNDASARTAPRYTPAPQAAAAAHDVGAVVNLASRYFDLQAALELARADAHESAALAEQGLAPQRDARLAAAHLRTSERKLLITRRLIDGEIAATQAELAWIDARRRDCSPTDALQLDVEASRAHTRLAALQAVE